MASEIDAATASVAPRVAPPPLHAWNNDRMDCGGGEAHEQVQEQVQEQVTSSLYLTAEAPLR